MLTPIVTGDLPDIKQTKDGHYIVHFRGKHYPVKEEQLEGLLAQIGMKMMLQAAESYTEQQLSRRAHFYHNGDEAGEQWLSQGVKRKS